MKLQSKTFISLGVLIAILMVSLFAVISASLNRFAGTVIVGGASDKLEAAAAKVSMRLSLASSSCEVLARVLMTMRESGSGDRVLAGSMVQEEFKRGATYEAVWVMFEPNAWDGRDAAYVNDDRYKPYGGFLPYAYRLDGALEFESSDDDEDERLNDYYQLPFKSGKAQFIEPYYEEWAGRKQMLTSYVVPLVHPDSQVYGVAGVDFSLEFLSSELAGISALEDVFICTAGGLLIAAPGNEKLLGQPSDSLPTMAGDAEFSRALESSGGEYALKNKAWRLVRPIGLGGQGQSWFLVATIPSKALFAERDRIIAYVALILAILSLIAFAAVWLLVRGIIKPVRFALHAFAQIEEGNLTYRMPVLSRDEMGELAKGYNLLALRLSALIDSFRQVTSGVLESSDALASDVRAMRGTLGEMRRDIGGTGVQVQEQMLSLAEAKSDVEHIVAELDALASAINNQSQGFGVALGGVESMIRKVDSVTTERERLSGETERLTAAGENGKLVLGRLSNRVSELERLSAGLAETNKVVAAIASKTNLLAMNAAIEAAHAGDAGKGFAVVASEIRQLAEGSRMQSSAIGTKLKEVRAAIEAASGESASAIKTISQMLEHVRLVSELEHQAQAADQSQRESVAGVVSSLENMRMAGEVVRRGSDTIRGASADVREIMEKLSRTSENVASSAHTMAQRAGEIELDGDRILERAGDNRENARRAVDNLMQFKME